MKKIILAIASFASVVMACAQSFDRGPFYAVEMNYFFTPDGGAFGKELSFAAPSLGFRFGYNFNPCINVGVGVAAPAALFKEGGTRTFSTPLEMNLSAEYELFKLNGSSVRLGLAGGTSVVSDNNWKYLFYDAQIKLALPSSGGFRPVLGLGARYYDSLGSVYKSRWTAGMSIAFYFDMGKPSRVRNADSLSD